MAAPSNTKWGSTVGGYGKIGISVTISNTNTQTKVHVEVWFWSKYSVSDTSNTYYYNNNATSATTSHGSVTIKTTVDSGSGWSTSNQKLLKETDYTYSRGTSAVKRNCAAKLSGVERVGGTMTVTTSYTIPALASYKITYNANGGSGAPGQQTKYYGKTLKLSSTKPTRAGYTFQGWGTSSTGSVVYAPGANYTANAADTLYAIWKANTWTVTYDANGGEGAPASQTKTYGIDLTLATDIPTRTNYNFLGWGTSAASSTIAYAPGDSYTSNAAITLFAIWEVAYTPPRITGFTADRCLADGELADEGKYVRVVFNWALDTVYSSGLTSIIIGYKLSTAESYTEVPVTATGLSGSVSQIIGDGAIDTEYEYDIRVTVTDDKGSSYSDQTVAALAYIMDFLAGGGGVAFGRPAYRPGMDVAYPTHFGNNVYDKYETPISNGCANIAGDVLDPDTTLESVIMTNVKTPSGGYMYIQTMFHAEKSISTNRAQFALPYNNEGPMYHRYYYGGVWSAWRKHIDEAELNNNLSLLLFYKEYSAKNISISGGSFKMVNVPAIPISGYGRILPSPPSCANSASGGVNSSFMCIWNTDFTADGLQVGIRNYGSAASKTDVTARVLYVKSGYYDSP